MRSVYCILSCAMLVTLVGCRATTINVRRPISVGPSSVPVRPALHASTYQPPISPPVPAAQRVGTAPSISTALGATQDAPVSRLLRPGAKSYHDGLWLLEPHQPGKIPIVFVHGLMSDRATWASMTESLRATPWINQHYEFWYFQYPTGEPFLRSALTLREQLSNALLTLDPSRRDAALNQTVLIGHSMGGLISKLQVSHSSDTIWKHAARVPLPAIRGTPQHLNELSRLFFFEPNWFVRRVIFIGTPHQGSAWASRSLGQLAAGMVQQSPDRQQLHRSLILANTGAFLPDFERRIPTSVDLLQPDSPLLAAMRSLTIPSGVRTHSIIGYRAGLLGEPSDGIVPVSSARHPGVASEYIVNDRHGQLTQSSSTATAVAQILAVHLNEFDER